MASARVILDSEDEEQDLESPIRSPATASANLSGPALSTGSTESREALGRKIHDAHLALMEPTPHVKESKTVDITSPTLPRAGQRTAVGQRETMAKDIFTFPGSSASGILPIQTKKLRSKTIVPSAQVKERNPQRSKSVGRTADQISREDSDSGTWEPTNAAKLLGEPVAVRKTRRMGGDDILEGLPKPKRPRRNDSSNSAKLSEIKTDLTSERVLLSEGQKQEYGRISPPSSSLPDNPLPPAAEVPTKESFRSLPEESSTIPFSSTPQALKTAQAEHSFGGSKNADYPSSLASASAATTPKTYSRIQRAKTTLGLGRERHDQDMSEDELSLRKKKQRKQLMAQDESVFSFESKTKSAKPSGRKASRGGHGHPSDEDELGSDDVELVKEHYKPRLSRSRSNCTADKLEDIAEQTVKALDNANVEVLVVSTSDPGHTKTAAGGKSGVKSGDNCTLEIEEEHDSALNADKNFTSKLKRRKSTIVEDGDLSDWSRLEQEKPSAKSKPKNKQKMERTTATTITHSTNTEKASTSSTTEGDRLEHQHSMADGVLSTIENNKLPRPLVSAGSIDETSAMIEKSPALDREATPFQKPVLDTEMVKTPVQTDNPRKGQHSPLNSGKVPYRVGLSKRCRIEPLLRIVRKP